MFMSCSSRLKKSGTMKLEARRRGQEMLYALSQSFKESGRVARRIKLSGTEHVDLPSARAPPIAGGPASGSVAGASVLRGTPLSPLLKWPGGKSAELELIKVHMPK